MSNTREYIVISYDGTLIMAQDCIILHATPKQIEALEDMPDVERFAIVRAMEESSSTIEDMAYELLMKDAGQVKE